MKTLFQHVVSQDTSGRNATNTFLSGKGDVLLTYESEALTSRAAGTDIQYVIPRQTMLIELPIAVIKNSGSKELAQKFIRFTKGPVAQDLFGQSGWRPVLPSAAKKYAVEVPGAARRLQDQRQDLRRLAGRGQEVVHAQRDHGQDRAWGRRPDLWLAQHRLQRPPCAVLHGRGRGQELPSPSGSSRRT